MVLLAYLSYLGPFVILVFDAIMKRDRNRRRQAISFAALVPTSIALFFMPWGDTAIWIVAAASVLALVYARWLHGLPRFIVIVSSVSFICQALGTFSPHIGDPAFRYYEMLYLPVYAALWIVPPLTIWHLWRCIPLVFDALRGGHWATEGVPLLARHRLLAAAMLCSLAVNILLYVQWSMQADIVTRETNIALGVMNSQLYRLDNLFTNQGAYQPAEWQSVALSSVQAYQSAATRVANLLHPHGTRTTSALYFLSRTLPEGIAATLQQPDPLAAKADAERISPVISAVWDAIRSVSESSPSTKESTYRQAVEQIMEKLQGTDALGFFEIQYQPK